MEFSFFGTCAWLQVAHWSPKTYGYFELGHLMGLFVAQRRLVRKALPDYFGTV